MKLQLTGHIPPNQKFLADSTDADVTALSSTGRKAIALQHFLARDAHYSPDTQIYPIYSFTVFLPSPMQLLAV